MTRGEPTKTIAHARAGGKRLTVHCLGHGCHHQAVKTSVEPEALERHEHKPARPAPLSWITPL
jgi:hypothetical protein